MLGSRAMHFGERSTDSVYSVACCFSADLWQLPAWVSGSLILELLPKRGTERNFWFVVSLGSLCSSWSEKWYLESLQRPWEFCYFLSNLMKDKIRSDPPKSSYCCRTFAVREAPIHRTTLMCYFQVSSKFLKRRFRDPKFH